MELFVNPEKYSYLIPALPGLAFFVIVIGLCVHRKLFMKLGSYISIVAIGTGALIATFLFIKMVTGGYADSHNYIRPWAFEFLTIGNLKIQFGIALDGISVFTIFMVTLVACLIQIYSTGYMQGDKNYGRYFAFHSLFVFSMIVMVMSDNLLSFFIGWELMGLCSYLLIGFFYQKHSAANAQKKAFLVTKLGDLGMLLGVLLLGALVLKAGVERPDDSPQTNGQEALTITERYDLGNISFNFTDPEYERIRVEFTEWEELKEKDEQGHLTPDEEEELHRIGTERHEAMLEYLNSNKPIQEFYLAADEALGEGEDFRRNLLKSYLGGRDVLVDTYYPYVMAVLTDPGRRFYNEKNELVTPAVGSKAWREYCDRLKTDSRYLQQVRNWNEFRKPAKTKTIEAWNSYLDELSALKTIGLKNDPVFAEWAAFLDKMKTLKPYGLTSNKRDELTTGLKNKLDQQESLPESGNGEQQQKIKNPILVAFLNDHINKITREDSRDKPQKFDDLINELAFISASEAKSMSDEFRSQAKKYINGDEKTVPNAIYAASFNNFADKLNSFRIAADSGYPVRYKTISIFQREVLNEADKYSTRPVSIKELIYEYDWEGKGYGWLLTLAALLLFCGAIGKSAQFPLHVWLPDAMEGPTPVSALIHAATMVAAGVYMVGRFYFLFDAAPYALTIIAYIGAITAFGAATIGLVLYDIKRVLAYSTISQLGYMMIGLGVGSITAGLFHLLAHAYFKALLFLGSGSVIHGSGTQDMREMGGLAKKMKWTYITFLAGTLALCGIFPFAGFWSKDEILGAAFKAAINGQIHLLIVFALGLAGAFLTAFYMFRLISLTFLGKYRGKNQVHESPPSMLIPLVILAVFATLYGLLGMPFSRSMNVIGKFIHHGYGHHEFSWLTAILMIVSLGVAVAGVLAGLKLLNWGNPFKERLKKRYPGFYRAVCYKYYIDEFYNEGIVVGVLFLCKVARIFDTYIVDGFVNGAAWAIERLAWLKGRIDLYIVDGAVNLVGLTVESASKLIRPLQSGYIQNAMFATVIFIVVVLLFTLMKATITHP